MTDTCIHCRVSLATLIGFWEVCPYGAQPYAVLCVPCCFCYLERHRGSLFIWHPAPASKPPSGER